MAPRLRFVASVLDGSMLTRRRLLSAASACAAAAIAVPLLPAADPPPPRAEDQASAWNAAALRHRTRRSRLALLGPAGALPAGTVVRAELERHAFRFGINLHPFGVVAPASQQALEAAVEGVFSAVTVPCYRGQSLYSRLPPYEAERGKPRREAFRAAASWARDRGLYVKGHPLLFFREPAWLQSLTPAEQEAATFAFVREETAAFAGLVQAWEVLNEPTLGPGQAPKKGAHAIAGVCSRLGTVPALIRAHAEAATGDPAAALIINDWVEDGRFADIVRGAIAGGARVDAVGLQHHELERHQKPAARQEVLDRFAALGRPVHLTELMIPSGSDAGRAAFRWKECVWPTTPEGEARQADEAEKIYRQAFAHPAVDGVTWWDPLDEFACLGVPCGLIRPDGTAKPVLERLRRLLREEWRSTATLTADAQGGAELAGFAGRYRLTAEVAGRRLSATVELGADGGPLSARFA
jgi:endo-1,4-beta-xylanase